MTECEPHRIRVPGFFTVERDAAGRPVVLGFGYIDLRDWGPWLDWSECLWPEWGVMPGEGE